MAILSCGNFRWYNGVALHIFHILHESLFSLLFIIFAAFYCDRNIKMGYFILRAILKKSILIAFFISNIAF